MSLPSCSICSIQFNNRQSLSRHKQKEHPETIMSKKRRSDDIVAVEEEPGPKDHRSGTVLAYRSSVEVLKSCGIEGKDLEAAILKKLKTDQEKDPVAFEEAKHFFSSSISEKSKKMKERSTKLKKAREAIKINPEAEDLFKTYFKGQLLEGLKWKTKDELKSLQLCSQYFTIALENADMFGANSMNSNDEIIHNAFHAFVSATLEGKSLETQNSGSCASPVSCDSPQSPHIPLTLCSSSSSSSSSSSFRPSSLLHKLGL
jgi:hypothetical protein